MYYIPQNNYKRKRYSSSKRKWRNWGSTIKSLRILELNSNFKTSCSVFTC